MPSASPGPLFAKRPRAYRAAVLRPKEIALHMAVASDLRKWVRPDWLWTTFPAGELRDKATGRKLNRMGLQTGWSDFIFVSPTAIFHALELKRIGEDLDEDQEEFRDRCLAAGVPWAVAETIDEAWDAFERWGCMRIRRASPAALIGAD